MRKTYQKIVEVLKYAGRPLAPHEFKDVNVHIVGEAGAAYYIRADLYIGCSESALGRRLREMRELKIVSSNRREGQAFVEYALIVKMHELETAKKDDVTPNECVTAHSREGA